MGLQKSQTRLSDYQQQLSSYFRYFVNHVELGECDCESCSVVSDSLQPHGLYSPWNSPGQNTGVGNLSLLQGIFPTQGLNPGLPHCKWILYHLSHKGSPRILEWVVYPFSSRSSWCRNWAGVSYIVGGFFTYRESYQRNPVELGDAFIFILIIPVF